MFARRPGPAARVDRFGPADDLDVRRDLAGAVLPRSDAEAAALPAAMPDGFDLLDSAD